MFEKLKAKWELDNRSMQKRAEKIRKKLLRSGGPVFKKYSIQKVYLFGSVQKGRSGEGSDIDILVEPLDAAIFWVFRHELEETLGMPVDVYTQKDDLNLTTKVKQHGELIYEI